jgi:hypothetical protein
VTEAMIQFPMPDWVRLIPISDVDTAERNLVTLLAGPPDQGQSRLAEYESVASEVIEGAAEQGIWVLGLAIPPGRPPALLSVTGFRLPITVDRHTTTDLLSYLEDHGGPGIAGLRFVPLGYDKTALLFHRNSDSGSQAQAFVPDANGQGCFLFTLAAQHPDRGAELARLLRDIINTAMPQPH